MSSQLPNDLKKCLLAAGVEDEESLRLALETDPDLRANYESWLIAMTLQMFAEIPDADALKSLVERAPILMEDSMIEAIEQAVAKAGTMGDKTNTTALSQRLAVLRTIKAEYEATQRAAPLANALVQFVQASSEQAARAVYAGHRDLLDTDDAEALLINSFEPEDKTARLVLEGRLTLLRRLRVAG